MSIYWGDLHVHCGITYGHGSLQNALQRAQEHLDFCAITGHAMWPDIPARTPETEFLVDFHVDGFRRLEAHWGEVRAALAAANTPEFVTFQSYEMHSITYGDHHIISPCDELPLIYRESPAALLRDVGCDALMIAHHIAYAPGYRGINWGAYNAATTPLVEVCSMHGCGMHETAPYPYLNNMGPRAGQNTVYAGLKRGNRFGFTASTDHHAGYPGTYGEGKLAVLADSRTRSSIWEALKNRRTYAVTGDRILCEFSINGAPMGSILPCSGQPRTVALHAETSYPLDRIVLYKNLEPLHILDGLTVRRKDASKGRYKIRIETGWGNDIEHLYRWDVQLRVADGHIRAHEKCFRGANVFVPSRELELVGEDINAMDNRVLRSTPQELAWQCFTRRNPSTRHPMMQAVIAEIEGDLHTVVDLTINGKAHRFTIAELLAEGYVGEMRPYQSEAYKIHPALHESEYLFDLSLEDVAPPGEDFYHVEVSQRNDQWAFVSPVYFAE